MNELKKLIHEIAQLRHEFCPLCGAERIENPSSCEIPPCDVCGRKQTRLGALEFGPPREFIGTSGLYCQKRHICQDCFYRKNRKC